MGTKIKKCSIISGAPDTDIAYIKQHLEPSFIIAADSGYEKCLSLDIMPDLIVGDFDSSIKPELDCEIIVLPSNKNDTDTFFALKEAIKRGYSDIMIYSALGNRFDHSYSNLMCLYFCHSKGIHCTIISEKNRIFIGDGKFRIYKSKYKYFSLFAFPEKCDGLTITGVKYPLCNHSLEVDSSLCQSNEISDEFAEISVKSGKLFVILSND